MSLKSLCHCIKKTAPLLTAVGGGCLLARRLYLENYRVELSTYVFAYPHLPPAFEGLTLFHLSDSHNGLMPEREEKRLKEALSEKSIDLIVMTGDLIDRRKPDFQSALRYAEKWLSVAPIYFVSGNHEARCQGGADFVTSLEQIGVQVLDHKKKVIERHNQKIILAGLPDPYAYGGQRAGPAYIRDASKVATSPEAFTLLLAHRPEYLSLYHRLQADLVFSGHAHGGQIRLPGIGGLYASGQGWFPRYTSGIYTLGSTAMVVSRGIGPSVFPQRLGNRPEVGLIRLTRGQYF